MKNLMNAVIVNGVAYQINATEAKKVAELLGLEVAQTTAKQSKESTTKSKAPKK